MRLADEVGVEFAYPTQTLHIDSVHADEPRKAAEDRTDEELTTAIYAFGPDGKLSKPKGIVLKRGDQEINLNANQ